MNLRLFFSGRAISPGQGHFLVVGQVFSFLDSQPDPHSSKATRLKSWKPDRAPPTAATTGKIASSRPPRKSTHPAPYWPHPAPLHRALGHPHRCPPPHPLCPASYSHDEVSQWRARWNSPQGVETCTPAIGDTGQRKSQQMALPQRCFD